MIRRPFVPVEKVKSKKKKKKKKQVAEQEVKLVDIALVRSANQSSIPTDPTFVLT